MAESNCPFLNTAGPQQPIQQAYGSSRQQNEGNNPNSGHLRWSHQHHMNDQTYRQSFEPAWQHYEHQYEGGFPSAFYMSEPSTEARHGPTGTPANYNHDAGQSIWFERDRNMDRSFNEHRFSRPSYGMNVPSLMYPPIHPQWIFPPPQHWSESFATYLPTHEIELDTEHNSGYNHTNREDSDSPQQTGAQPFRRMPYQRPSRIPDLGNQQRRHVLRPFSSSTSFPELTPLPRSNRRSFDRFSHDLDNNNVATNSMTFPQSLRATADRPNRRPRPLAHPNMSRARYFGQSEHPNVPTVSQMQALRDKLRHFLPKELPEGSDTTCDICQKDYSTTHVAPSEDEEIAMQLPCKHIFGEHCINTWFETCKKDKLKMTCPMCRKILIEPLSRGNATSSRALLEGMQRHRRDGIARQASGGGVPITASEQSR